MLRLRVWLVDFFFLFRWCVRVSVSVCVCIPYAKPYYGMEWSSASASPLICQEWLSWLIEMLPLKFHSTPHTVNTATQCNSLPQRPPFRFCFSALFLNIGVWRLARFKFVLLFFSLEERRFIRRDACGEKLASKALICIINWVVIHTFWVTEGERDRLAPQYFHFLLIFPFLFSLLHLHSNSICSTGIISCPFLVEINSFFSLLFISEFNNITQRYFGFPEKQVEMLRAVSAVIFRLPLCRFPYFPRCLCVSVPHLVNEYIMNSKHQAYRYLHILASRQR